MAAAMSKRRGLPRSASHPASGMVRPKNTTPMPSAVSFLVMYIGYFVFTFYYVRNRHGVRLPAATSRAWLVGLALVLAFSWFTWNLDGLTVTGIAALALAVAGFYWIAFSPAERLQLLRLAGSTLRLTKERGA